MLNKLLTKVYDVTQKFEDNAIGEQKSFQNFINFNSDHFPSVLGIGLDSAIIPLKHDLYLVQSVDFFYPLCDDPKLMGE